MGHLVPDTEDELADKVMTQTAKSGLLDPLRPDFDWRVKFRHDAVTQLEKWSSDFGVPKFILDSFVRDNIDGATNWIARFINVDEVGQPITAVARLRPLSLQEYQLVWDQGMGYFSRMSGLNFDGLSAPRGSGSGSRKPTAGEIRAMYDEDELTERVDQLWGAYLIEDAPNARRLAKDYINAIVASGGEQKIDFNTFVLNKIRATNRHKLVYRSKPEGTDELTYIAPYRQAAISVIGGGGQPGSTANDVAAAGGAFGATGSEFSDRLARTPEHTGTTGFITNLEQRVRGIKNVLRG